MTPLLRLLLHSRAVWLCPCVRHIAGSLQTRSLFGVWTTDRPLLLPGKRCRQQEVNSAGAFRQIFGLQGVTVLFGASGGGGCAGGGPAPAPRSSQKPGVLVPILAVRGGGGRVQPWLSGSRQVRDSGPTYSAFSPHILPNVGPEGSFGAATGLRGGLWRGGAVQGQV